MWIRSQDKTKLVEVKDYINLIWEEKYIEVNNVIVARYETEERAMQVLTEIQNAIIRDTEYVSTPIYEMPKE